MLGKLLQLGQLSELLSRCHGAQEYERCSCHQDLAPGVDGRLHDVLWVSYRTAIIRS